MTRPTAVRRIVIVLACFLAAGTAGISAGEKDGADAAIARAWMARAVSLTGTDTITPDAAEEALKAVEIAGEFVPGSSDALYVRSRLALSGYTGEGTGEGTGGEGPVAAASLKLAEAALDAAAAGDIVLFDDKAALYSSLALRLREYEALTRRYDDWPAGHRLNPILIYAASRARIYTGRYAEAAALARKGESLADAGTNLSVLGRAFDIPAVPAFRALAVAAGDEDSIETLDAVRRWGPALDRALLPWILSGYADAALVHDDSPVYASLIAVSSAGDADGVTAADIGRWPESVFADLALMRRIRDGSGEEARNEIDSRIGNYTGVMTVDADYDGYPEETIRLVNGRPDYRWIDTDQDGRREWDIVFSDSLPLQIRQEDGRTTVNYGRAAYPAVISLVQREDRAVFTVTFHPGAFEWEPWTGGPVWGSFRRPPEDRDALWAAARRMEVETFETDSGTARRAVTAIADGLPVRALETTWTDGRGESADSIREILYEGGYPVAGRLSYRGDGNGGRLWELYERYERGRLIGLAWDPGMTGTPAYLRDWALGLYLETRAWNPDGDEWMDARRFALPDGRVSARDLMITEARAEDLIPWSAGDWSPWDH